MAQTYEPTDRELIRWVGTWTTEAEVNGAGYQFGARTPVPGEVVVTHSHGRLRRGVVVAVGTKNARVALTTPSAAEQTHQGYELTRVAGKPMPFDLVAVAPDHPQMVDGQEPESQHREPGYDIEVSPDYPFGAFRAPHAQTAPSDRDGAAVEVHARGQWADSQVVTGRIVGQVAGLHNTEGFYVVEHPDGTYNTYDKRIVFEAPAQPAQEPAQAPEGDGAAEDPAVAGSEVVAALERVWEAIRGNHPDLPEVIIVTGSGLVGPPRWGHFRRDAWKTRTETDVALDATGGRAELFVAGESLARGAEWTVETMLHEAAHTLAWVREIKDTSRQGRWHNQRFRSLAEELGLEHQGQTAHPQHGFYDVTLTPGTREEYAEVIEGLDKAVRTYLVMPGVLAGAQGSGERIQGGGRAGGAEREDGEKAPTGNVKAVCQCETPRIIRASRKVLAEAPVLCGVCRAPFAERE